MLTTEEKLNVASTYEGYFYTYYILTFTPK